MKQLSAFLALTVSVWCFGCEDPKNLYSPAERRAVERFESVAVGSSEEGLRGRLGAPTCVVSMESTDAPTIAVRCPEHAQAVVVERERRRDWPPELGALNSKMPTRRVLIYLEATVYGHFFVGDDGTVVKVEVKVS